MKKARKSQCFFAKNKHLQFKKKMPSNQIFKRFKFLTPEKHTNKKFIVKKITAFKRYLAKQISKASNGNILYNFSLIRYMKFTDKYEFRCKKVNDKGVPNLMMIN